MNNQRNVLKHNSKNAAIFERAENKTIYPSRLFEVPCGAGDKCQGSARTCGLAVLETNHGRFEADALTVTSEQFTKDSACFSLTSPMGLRLESRWQVCVETGLLSRKDSLHNDSLDPIKVSRCLARFAFPPGHYQYFSQSSSWCNENQGFWQEMHHGTVVLGCEGGRTAQGGTPYLGWRDQDTNRGLAFHVICTGNWTMKIRACTPETRVHLPFMVLEMGLADESLNLELPGQGSFDLPEILIQSLPAGRVEEAAPDLHRYLLKQFFTDAKPSAPVVYNTWFDAFECLDVSRLRRQLVAARKIGCEVFVVDAGWYGRGPGFWYEQIGDWREKLDGAFHGKMTEFADEVRAAGLGFGLWMEPERNCSNVPAVKEHPEWFLPGAGGCFYPNLCRPDAYQYILAEMSRLIETYKLAWMKIDYNFELSIDPTGSEFANYYHHWYKLLDQLRSRYPQTFFEGCASGGMRLELNTLSYHDDHFLSDSINPADCLRIYQQALLRLPPGRIGRWAGLRSVGRTIAQYQVPIQDSPESIVTPAGCGATWEVSQTVDVDFAARTAMVGMLGLSGDIAGLSGQSQARLARNLAFYKQWRELIAASHAHLLTPVRLKDEHSGWIAFQLQQSNRPENLLFVYRLDDAREERSFVLRNLDPQQPYTIKNEDTPGVAAQPSAGAQLMDSGLSVTLTDRDRAAVIVIAP